MIHEGETTLQSRCSVRAVPPGDSVRRSIVRASDVSFERGTQTNYYPSKYRRRRLMIRLHVITCVVLALGAQGCATPAEVKQLSLKQTEYFDAAIEAVALQSEALILAAERMSGQAKERIDALERRTRASIEKLIIDGQLSTDENAAKAASKIAASASTAAASRANLDRQLAAIRAKSQELLAYLRKMKEVHQALDAYMQSRKAGEAVLNDVFNHPTVKTMLGKVNDFLPRIEEGMQSLTAVVNEIATEGDL